MVQILSGSLLWRDHHVAPALSKCSRLAPSDGLVEKGAEAERAERSSCGGKDGGERKKGKEQTCPDHSAVGGAKLIHIWSLPQRGDGMILIKLDDDSPSPTASLLSSQLGEIIWERRGERKPLRKTPALLRKDVA